MYAKVAGRLMHSYVQVVFNDLAMATTCCQNFIDAFDTLDSGSHKHIPVDKLNTDLELASGQGVYGYHKFTDGSYLLLTCDGPLACWTGAREDVAEWVGEVKGYHEKEPG